MIYLLKKIGVLFTAICVFFSTMSFPITYHYCEGEIAEVTYFVEPNGCEMEMEQDIECEEGFACKDISNSISKENCCKDVTKIVSSSVFISPKVIKIYKIITAFIPFLNKKELIFESAENKKHTFSFYSPPQKIFNFQSKYQVYLI